MLCRYRVVVATCNSAGLLYTADLKAGHFTHAFVDEVSPVASFDQSVGGVTMEFYCLNLVIISVSTWRK